MRQITNSSFNEGLLMDMNPLVTPQTCLTDCLNGTLITYNGNEFTLQNDMGNVKINRSEISPGYIPMGMKEYGGIIYLALYNPELNKCEIGSIPSPDYDTSPSSKESGSNIESSALGFIEKNEDKSFTFNQKLIRLFEFEQLTLNPGDEYAIQYSIAENTENVFSETSIYKVNFYAIDKDNKQHILKSRNLFTDENPIPYKYFDQTISSIIGLQISINEINWFEVALNQINETEIKFSFNGKNKLGTDDPKDDLYIRGCKIAFKDRELYLDGGTNTDKFSETFTFKLSDLNLSEGDLVDFSIIPYDQYTYLHNLKRKLRLTVGKKFIPSESDDIFKYKYSSENKVLKLDFNLPAYMENPYMYVEFYDIWSDYSVIIPIEDVNPLGTNTLFLDTVNEPVINEYLITRGGVDKTLITPYNFDTEIDSNKVYKPFISDFVRRNGILRENNMYLVRLAVIDKNKFPDASKINVNDYTSKYKLLVINENYNDVYDRLNESGIYSGETSDFNTINLNNKLSVSLDTSLTLNNKGNLIKTTEGEFTIKTIKDGKDYYYKYLETELSVNNIEQQSELFSKSDTYSVTSKLKSVTNSLGSVSLLGFTIKNSDYNPNIKDSDTSVKSESTINLINNDVTFTLKTNRLIKAYVFKENKLFSVVGSTTKIIDFFHTGKNPSGNIPDLTKPGLYLDGRKTSCYPRDIFNYWNNQQVNDRDSGWDGVAGVALTQAFDTLGVSGAALNTIGKYNGESFGLKIIETGQIVNKDWYLVFRGVDNKGIGITYNSKNAVNEILSDLQSSIITNTNKYLYYYNNVESNPISKTQLKGTLDLNLNTTLNIFQNIKSGNTMVSSDSNEDFFKKINELLESREIPQIQKVDYFTLGELNQEVKYTLDIPFMSIEVGSSDELRQSLINGKNDLFINHPEISNPEVVKDKTVYSKTGLYDNIAKRFSVIYNEGIPTYYYNPQNLKSAKWYVGGKGEKNDGEAFDIDTNPFDIR